MQLEHPAAVGVHMTIVGAHGDCGGGDDGGGQPLPDLGDAAPFPARVAAPGERAEWDEKEQLLRGERGAPCERCRGI